MQPLNLHVNNNLFQRLITSINKTDTPKCYSGNFSIACCTIKASLGVILYLFLVQI